MAKKFLAALFLFLSLLLSSTSVSYAQDDTPGGPIGSIDDPWKPDYDSAEFVNYRAAIEDDGCLTPSLECLVHQVFRFASMEFVTSTLYTEFKPDYGTGSIDNPTPVASGANQSLMQSTGKLIGLMYSYPVANTNTYVADLMNSAHITPRAYAQGLGFASLNPILELWKAFRNLAYMFFVIIFIIIGFMIMFRQKIGGQAAVTAQQAIPGVIVSLILVTFSYAIAGLLIDLMYVLMFLIIGVFGETLPTGTTNLIDMNIRELGYTLFVGNGLGSNVDLVTNLFSSLVGDDTLSSGLGIIGGLTLTVVLAIAILIGTIKLFFELLKSYASIVLSVVTSPITLMMGALPGKNPVKDWIKDLVGNLLPFPTILLVLVIFHQFKSMTSGDGTGGGFMPPFLLGRGQAGAITSLMGLALILALPEIVKDVKKGLVKEGFGTTVFKAATESVKEGWKGGKIPGLGIQVPGAKAPLRFGAAAAGGVAGGLYGAASNIIRKAPPFKQPTKESAGSAAATGAARAFFRTGGALGSKYINPETPKKLEEYLKKRNKTK